jgi:catechol 2,3-dioxygenase-like lactoylglutathione lyase family enzyme
MTPRAVLPDGSSPPEGLPGHQVQFVFHSTAMVPDYDATIGTFARLFGLTVLEYSEQLIPEIGRKGGMTWIGDNSIEIGEPIVAGAGADKFVTRTGGGVHSIAVQVGDIEASLAHVQACGVRVAARPRPDFYFSDPRDTGGIFIEWSMIDLPEDPRFYAPPPAKTCEPLLDVTHHAFVGAVVDDPMASAMQMSQLFATPITYIDRSAPPDRPMAAVSMGDCSLLLYQFVADQPASVWGRSMAKPRTHLIGLKVPDLAVAEVLLEREGVAILRRTPDQILIDPAATSELAVALVEHLPFGDPRLRR